MGNREENFVIDSNFLLESSHHAFCGAPLIATPDGLDQTFVFGFTRDLLRLRLRLGIRSFVCVFNSDTNTTTPENLSQVVSLMEQLQIPMVCEKWNRGSIIKNLAKYATWIISRDLSLAQLVNENCRLLIPHENGEISTITIDQMKKQFGIRPSQVPSYLALHDDKNPLLTKRQAKKFLEDHDCLATT